MERAHEKMSWLCFLASVCSVIFNACKLVQIALIHCLYVCLVCGGAINRDAEYVSQGQEDQKSVR